MDNKQITNIKSTYFILTIMILSSQILLIMIKNCYSCIYEYEYNIIIYDIKPLLTGTFAHLYIHVSYFIRYRYNLLYYKQL